MKKIKYILLVTLIVVVGIYLYGYLDGYRILNVNSSIENELDESIDDHVERKTYDYITDSVHVREKIKIDGQLIVYFTYNVADHNITKEQDGFIVLNRGINLNYKSRTTLFREGDRNSDPEPSYLRIIINGEDGDYMVIMGEGDASNHEVEYSIDGVKYKKTIEEGPFFILRHKLT